MKMMLKKLNAVKLRAFTLIEMLVVLLIISILLLLFVPNLSKQKDWKCGCGQGRGFSSRTL